VEPLIACLKAWNEGVRRSAFDALDSLGATMKMEGLVEALPDWDLKDRLGRSLNKLGWKPASDSEQVYFWICISDGANLKTNWNKTTHVLLADMQSGNQRKIENAVYTFISLGREDIVPKLIDILDTQGTKEMAETYLNCGHDGLENAARSWASAHGYQISSRGNGGKAAWGKW